MYGKRFWIALMLGIIAGVICAAAGYSDTPEDIRTMSVVSVILNRAFIGFLIGISGWRLRWYFHGIILGMFGTLPLSVPLIFSAEAGVNVFLMFTAAGIVWGFLIELLTSLVFKAPMRAEVKA
ncbi:MAG: hypothetical protein PVI66_13345 [Candidatus Aminicenantes bacterium]|jgi:hypothetical protein